MPAKLEQSARRMLDFSGSSERLQNTTSQDLGLGANWTVATWYYAKSLSGGGGVFNFRTGATNPNQISLHIGSSVASLVALVMGSGGITTKQYTYLVDFNIHTWYSVALSWDGTNLVLYVNGAAITATTLNVDNAVTMTNTNRGVYIGGSQAAADASILWLGTAAWNETLTANEKAALTDPNNILRDVRGDWLDYASSANLVHYWRPLQNVSPQSGTTYVCDDLAGAGVDVSANAAGMADADLTTDLDDLPYLTSRNHSLDFDGSSEYMRSTGNVAVGIANAWSLKFSVYSDRDTADEVFLHFKPAASTDSEIKLSKLGTVANDPLRVLIGNSTSGTIKDYQWDSALPSGQWSTYTLVFDGSADTLKLYDAAGDEVAPDTLTTDGTGTQAAASRAVAIGADITGANFFDGRVREVALWSSVLSVGQLAELALPRAHLHKRSANNVGSTIAGLVRWWLLGVPSPSLFKTTNALDHLFDFGVSNAVAMTGGSGVSSADIDTADGP